MPRIDPTTERKASWQEIESLILENLFNPLPSEKERLEQEIKDLIEEAKKHVCETDKREND